MTTITAYGHTIEFEALPAKSIEYLLTYGFKQSVADSSAGPAAEAKKAGKSEIEIQAIVDEARAKRVEALLAGTVGIRTGNGGGGMTALEREVRKIGMEVLEKKAKAAGVSLRAPKGSDEATREQIATMREQLFDRLLAVHKPEWTAEAERRLAALTPSTEVADDLFAAFAPATEDDDTAE